MEAFWKRMILVSGLDYMIEGFLLWVVGFGFWVFVKWKWIIGLWNKWIILEWNGGMALGFFILVDLRILFLEWILVLVYLRLEVLMNFYLFRRF